MLRGISRATRALSSSSTPVAPRKTLRVTTPPDSRFTLDIAAILDKASIDAPTLVKAYFRLIPKDKFAFLAEFGSALAALARATPGQDKRLMASVAALPGAVKLLADMRADMQQCVLCGSALCWEERQGGAEGSDGVHT